MQVETVRGYFDALAALKSLPALANASGSCRFDIEGAGTFTIVVDRGAIAVNEDPVAVASCRVQVGADDFLRLARGEDHENLTTAYLRGAIRFQGDPGVGRLVQAVMPLPERGSITS